MAGPSQAALVAAVSAILALKMPPLAWLSGAVIALVALHLGPKRGMQLMGFSTLAVMLLGWVAIGTPILAFSIVMLLWMPVWLAAVVLYRTVSLALALQLITAMALLFVLALQSFYPELQLALGQQFAEIIEPVINQQPNDQARQNLTDALATILPLLPGLLAMGMMMGAILSLLLGRWWQSALYNPGGLATEFNQLRLGKLPATASLVLLIAAVLSAEIQVMILLLVVSALYLIQGLALIHGVVALKQINRAWLAALYFLIFIMPQLVLLPVVVVGLSDAWIDYRRRLNAN